MGDNRDESMDSRTFGCIPLEKVEGKVVLRYWPITQLIKNRIVNSKKEALIK